MFSRTTICLLFAASLMAAPSKTSASNLRRPKEALRRLVKSTECTLMVVSDALTEGVLEGVFDDETFECEMDAADMNGNSGLSLPIHASLGQTNDLKIMLHSGDLIPGVSKLQHGAKAFINREGLLIPPGLVISNAVRKIPEGKRRLAVVTGVKPILVVKVTDSVNKARYEHAAQIGDKVFGTVTDTVNLASQMKACSFGTLNIVPGTIAQSSAQAAPGVIEVSIPIPLEGNSRAVIRNAVTTAVQAKLGISLPGPYEQVMYVLEGCYQDCGWAAYAYINSWNSVYQGNYYYMVGVQMHELGHNFNLAHSGGLNGATYTDHTGLMGNPLYSDEIGKMCFNAAKNWQIGWYDTKKLLVDPLLNPSTTVKLVGIANFDTLSNNDPVVVKVETGTGADYFIGFNRAIGVNAENDEADNEVTIVKVGSGHGESYSQSYLMATLVQGESYTIPGFDWVIEPQKIDIVADPAVATVSIISTALDAPTKSPITFPPVTSAPTKSPVTSAPTKSPVTSAPTKSPVTSAPSKSTTKFPTKSPATASPTSHCGTYTNKGKCKKAKVCIWNKGCTNI